MAKYSLSSRLQKTYESPEPPLGAKRSVLNKIVGFGFLLLVAISGGTFAFFYVRALRNEKANLLLARAMETYQASLQKDNEVASISMNVQRYKTSEERAAATLKLIDELIQTYPKTTITGMAKILQANILFDLGKFSEAATMYQQKSQDPSVKSDIKPFLKEAFLLSIESQNRREEALKQWELERKTQPEFYQSWFEWNYARLLASDSTTVPIRREIYMKLAKLDDWSPVWKARIQNQLLELE